MTDLSLADPPSALGQQAGLRSDLNASRVRSAWIFLAPTLLVLALVAGWPLLRTIYFSFTNASLTNLEGAEFVGLKNYLSWITLKSGRTVYNGLLADPAWWNAVWNTLKFSAISVTIETVLGLAPDAPRTAAGADLPTRVAAFEAEVIEDALRRHGGRVSAALGDLGIPRKTFYDKVTRHGIDLDAFRR